MPELPEVETIVQSLRAHILQRSVSGLTVLLPKIIRSQEGDYHDLIGKTLLNIFRWGKSIIFEFSEGWHVRIHLKMTGQLVVKLPHEYLEKHTHAIFSLDGGELELRYRDIRQFGYIQILTPEEWSRLLHDNPFGPDPLEISFPLFLARLQGKKGKIKAVLLDQTFLAGLGNIYTDEILYQAQIHPQTPSVHLSAEMAHCIYDKMQDILHAAIQQRGSSIRNYIEASGEQGKYQFSLQVYGKAGLPCRRCGTRIEKIRVAGRGTYFCPQCQKEW